MPSTATAPCRALALPATPAAQGVRLRPKTPDDLPFLQGLYVAVRWPELAIAPWSDEDKLRFLLGQFDLQAAHYDRHYAGTEFSVVLHDGEPIGRLYLHRGPTELRLMEISLLPEWRGRGIGGALIRAVLAEADATGLPVSLHVEPSNPARRLYARLGFTETGGDAMNLRLERRPAAPTTSLACPTA